MKLEHTDVLPVLTVGVRGYATKMVGVLVTRTSVHCRIHAIPKSSLNVKMINSAVGIEPVTRIQAHAMDLVDALQKRSVESMKV